MAKPYYPLCFYCWARSGYEIKKQDQMQCRPAMGHCSQCGNFLDLIDPRDVEKQSTSQQEG